MKITKRQLRRIIKEEKAKLLRESMTDMADVENEIERAVKPIGDVFMTKMFALWEEGPAEGLNLSEVYPDEEAWEMAVNDAVLELDTGAARAVERVIQDLEVRLINGDI